MFPNTDSDMKVQRKREREPAFIGAALQVAQMLPGMIKGVAGLFKNKEEAANKTNGALAMAGNMADHANDYQTEQEYNKRFNVDYAKGGELKFNGAGMTVVGRDGKVRTVDPNRISTAFIKKNGYSEWGGSEGQRVRKVYRKGDFNNEGYLKSDSLHLVTNGGLGSRDIRDRTIYDHEYSREEVAKRELAKKFDIPVASTIKSMDVKVNEAEHKAAVEAGKRKSAKYIVSKPTNYQNTGNSYVDDNVNKFTDELNVYRSSHRKPEVEAAKERIRQGDGESINRFLDVADAMKSSGKLNDEMYNQLLSEYGVKGRAATVNKDANNAEFSNIRAPKNLVTTMKATVGAITAPLVKGMIDHAPQSGATPTVKPIGSNEVVVGGGANKRDGINIDAPNGIKAKVNKGEVLKVEPDTGTMKVLSTSPELGNPAAKVKEGEKGFEQAFKEQEIKKNTTIKGIDKLNSMKVKRTGSYNGDEFPLKRRLLGYDKNAGAFGNDSTYVQNEYEPYNITVVGGGRKGYQTELADPTAAINPRTSKTAREALSKDDYNFHDDKPIRFTDAQNRYDYEPSEITYPSNPTFNGTIYKGWSRNPNGKGYFQGAANGASTTPVANVNMPDANVDNSTTPIPETTPVATPVATRAVATKPKVNPLAAGRAAFLANRANDNSLEKTIAGSTITTPTIAKPNLAVSSDVKAPAIGMKSSTDAIADTNKIYADNKKGFFGKIGDALGSDKFGDVVNSVAPVLSSIFTANKANDIQAPAPPPQIPNEYTRTRVNVNPQIQASRRAMHATVRENESNTISSAARVARNSKAYGDNAQREAEIYGTRENMETQLQQGAAQMRSRNNTYNSMNMAKHNENVAAVNNQKTMMKIQAMNSGLAGVTGAYRDMQSRKDKNYMDDQTIRAMVAGSPEGSTQRMLEFGVGSAQSRANMFNLETDPAKRAKLFKTFTDKERKAYNIKP